MNDNSSVTVSPGRVKQSAYVVSVVDHDDTVLMDVVQGAYYSLDSVGSRIWQLLTEPATPAELVARISSEYDAPEELVMKDVSRLLQELSEAHLVVSE